MDAFSGQWLLKCELAFTSPAVADSYHGAAGLLEAEKKFRKVKGYRELKELNRILNPELHSQAQVA